MQQNFIKSIIEEDLKSGKHKKIITRFPPEPNGFLHIGHARAIIINFELAKFFKGSTNLRFDDTNPDKENDDYCKQIISDIKWLGYKPKHIFYASSYFDIMYEKAVLLIKKGLAYVDDQSIEEIQKSRGNLTTPGVNSPYRNRTVAENLSLFAEMKEGKFPDGAKVLRAKIAMDDPNMNNRDPVIYRILSLSHHRVGNKYKIYPMYDYAHPLEDAIEGITHSLCSLEFEDHRPLYDWFVKNCEMTHTPQQIEFGRLNIERTVLSKRYLRSLVEEKLVSGWDDPRMPTISGLRNRGYTPNAIRRFILDTGLSKTNGSAKLDMLESFIREDLNQKVRPISGVISPLKVIITNYPSLTPEKLSYKNPLNQTQFTYFGKEIFIEASDFCEEKPNNKYKRLYLGGEVRLMHGYFIKCNEIVKNDDGSIKELHCTYDPATKSGSNFNARKPNGTIHFVESSTAINCDFYQYEPLLDDNESEEDYTKRFNNNSLVISHGVVEPYVLKLKNKTRCQMIRNGYYIINSTNKDKVLVGEIVKLKSSFAK